MKSVSSQVTSSTAVSLPKASKILSNFTSIDNGASHAVSVYLRRAAVSFADLNHFHKDLKSSSSSKPHKKHTQITIAFDFVQDEPEIEGNEKKVKESEGCFGIEVDEKRKGDEFDNVSGESAEWSEVSKKKRRKMEVN